jgi:hypothetical protein
VAYLKLALWGPYEGRAQQPLEIANVLQDEVLRRLGGVVGPGKKYTEGGRGVSCHAWHGQGRTGQACLHAPRKKKQMAQEIVAAALAGDAMPLVERAVYHAASEMQTLEDSIRGFKNKMSELIGADNTAASRRKEGKAVWEEKKDTLTKEVDTALLE